MNREEVERILALADEAHEDACFNDEDLGGVDLSGLDLSYVDIMGTNFQGANLRGANLRGANAYEANFQGADLRGAKLSYTNGSADFTGANLTDTCLDPAAPIPPISDEDLLEAGFIIKGKWVYGWRTRRSIYYGGTIYHSGKSYRPPVFSVSDQECHFGIYMGGEKWRMENSYENLVSCRSLRSDLHKAGDKFRTRKLHVPRNQG